MRQHSRDWDRAGQRDIDSEIGIEKEKEEAGMSALAGEGEGVE